MSYFENALEIYCEKSWNWTKRADEWWDEWSGEGATKITIEWTEKWLSPNGQEECELTSEMEVDTLRKASNLVGALLLGLKTHKSFSQKDFCHQEHCGHFDDNDRVPSDFRLVSTVVKRLDENSDEIM